MDADHPKKRRRRPTHRQVAVFVLLVVVALVAGAVYATVRGYQSVSRATKRDYYSGLTPDDMRTFGTSNPDIFVVAADIQSVSPDAHTATARLTFSDTGTKYLKDRGVVLRRDLTLSLYGTIADPASSALNSYTLHKGLAPSVEVTMALPDGESSKYPFDSYHGFLIANTRTTDGKAVPTLLVVSNQADGWTVSKSLIAQGKALGWDMHLSRASDAQLYAVFIMALMWALALAGVVMAVILIRNPKREISVDVLVYLAALLFALPLIRTLLPGNPGLGVLADFAVYFWVEAVVGVTLVVLLFVWIERNRPPHTRPPRPLPEADGEAAAAVNDDAAPLSSSS
jgi:uncharacterized protein DUF4436